MKTIKISIEISRKSAMLLLALLVVAAVAQRIYSENVTITTSYPSPSGIYSKLITTGDTWLTRNGGRLAIGTDAMRPVEMQLHRETENAAFRITSPSNKNSAVQLYDHPTQTGWALLKEGRAGGSGNFYIREDTAENAGVSPAALSISRTSRNVGIGTDTPQAKLDVNGQALVQEGLQVNGQALVQGGLQVNGVLRIQGGSPGAGKVLTSDANGLATWSAPSSGGCTAQRTRGWGGNRGGENYGILYTICSEECTAEGYRSVAVIRHYGNGDDRTVIFDYKCCN